MTPGRQVSELNGTVGHRASANREQTTGWRGETPPHLVARSIENGVAKHSCSLSCGYYLGQSGNISQPRAPHSAVRGWVAVHELLPVLEELRISSKVLAILHLL